MMSIRKISNDVLISFLWISSLAVFIIIAFVLGIAFLFYPEIRSIVYVLGSLFFMLTLIFIFHWKVFNFENSGEVVIISNYNLLHLFLKNYFTNKIELPIDKVVNCEVRKIMLQRYLIVSIKRHNEKIMKVFFSLQYLSDANIHFIEASLNKTENMNTGKVNHN